MYANDKVDSDVRLNAQLLDVWAANANQDIYILIRLQQYNHDICARPIQTVYVYPHSNALH